jgi:hypothetical protein
MGTRGSRVGTGVEWILIPRSLSLFYLPLHPLPLLPARYIVSCNPLRGWLNTKPHMLESRCTAPSLAGRYLQHCIRQVHGVRIGLPPSLFRFKHGGEILWRHWSKRHLVVVGKPFNFGPVLEPYIRRAPERKYALQLIDVRLACAFTLRQADARYLCTCVCLCVHLRASLSLSLSLSVSACAQREK